MEPRMANPALIIPEAMPAILALNDAIKLGGVPEETLSLVHLRVSQINGCSSCVESGSCDLRAKGASDQRLFAVSAWRESPHFSDAERAALALGEAVTRLADRTNPVPDEVWDEAARYYNQRALASLVLAIATTNVFNRLNIATRQVAGSWS